MEYNPLIYGKSNLEKIVSIEVNNGSAELFVKTDDGVKSIFVDNKFWVLSPAALDKSWVRLKGNLYYKYGKQFKEEFDAIELLLSSSFASVIPITLLILDTIIVADTIDSTSLDLTNESDLRCIFYLCKNKL